MSIYRIVNLNFDFNLYKECLEGQWEKFEINTSDMQYCDSMIMGSIVGGNYIIINRDIKFLHLNTLTGAENIINANNYILIANKDYSKAFLQCSDKYTNGLLLGYYFYCHAVRQSMIQFHSSLIRVGGNGLMFLGPSGIGKTTQAELWNQYRDALIINGDVVFVQETSDDFLGWGTPWHGSSPYCENTSVPVKALIVLKQAPENSIRELTGFEKVTAVSNNVFYPRWLEGGMELCLETLNHLLSALPVYELSCRPDEEAVRLTEEAVFGGSV